MTGSRLIVWVLAVSLLSACTSIDGVEECQEPPVTEQTLPASDFSLTIAPNPVAPGEVADLVIGVAEDTAENVANAPEGAIVTGAGARFQCWDGTTWLDTHQLIKDGFGPGNAPAAIDLGPDVTVTIPAVGLFVKDQPFSIVVPDMPSGIYRIEDSVIVESIERPVNSLPVYGLIEIEGD